MLTRDELVDFLRKHRGEKVLSVYLNATEHDPAKRRVWRQTLKHIVDRARAGLAGESGDLDAFDRARARLDTELERYEAFLPDRGWAGFATAAGTLRAETLPVAMPDVARWADGPSIAPYVRVLPLTLPVLTVLVDHRQAKLFRSQHGAFDEVWALRADLSWGDLSDNVNMSKRATTHTGVRGEADTDVANRLERVAVERLLKSVVEAVGEYAGRDGRMIVGGPPETTAAALALLPKTLHERAIEEPTIDFHTTAAELARATEAAAAVLASRLQERVVNQVVDLAGAGGRGCLGRRPTEQALEQRRVELLLVSRALVESDPEFAERSVSAAFEQAAMVEEVIGAGADRLQRDGQGIGARLRYAT